MRDPLAPPTSSARLYLRLAPKHVGLLRFFLEPHGHLAYFTVVDRRAAVVKLVFAPGAEARVRDVVRGLSGEFPLELVEPPLNRC